MTWQGSGGTPDSPGDDPASDETRTDWAIGGGTHEPIPAAPPPPPGPSDVQPATPPPAEPPAPPPVPQAMPGAAAPPPGYGAAPPGYGSAQPGYGASQPGAPVAWAPPPSGYAPTGLEVPGVPGLRFGGTLHRVIAYWIDGILIGIGATILASIAGSAAGGTTGIATLITAVVYVGLEFLYFVGLWTSGSRATLGMRVMKLQIGNAFDGRTLTMNQAVVRWLALALPFQAAGFVPELAAVAGLAGLWTLVLLISTAVSPTRQGIHDRIANSAIVQPIGASTPAVACLLLLVLLLLIPFIAIISLIFLGGQVSAILSAVGESVQP